MLAPEYVAPDGTALRHKETGRLVARGETLPDFRGDPVVVGDWYALPAPSTGRVVTADGHGYYPSVVGCEIIAAPL